VGVFRANFMNIQLQRDIFSSNQVSLLGQSRNMSATNSDETGRGTRTYEYMDEEHSDEYMDDTINTSTWTRNIVTSTGTTQINMSATNMSIANSSETIH
jgi:hypothetical protein